MIHSRDGGSHAFLGFLTAKGVNMGRALVIKPGDRFGKITILREEGKDKHRKRQFLCLCDCGEMRIRLLNTLRRKEK